MDDNFQKCISDINSVMAKEFNLSPGNITAGILGHSPMHILAGLNEIVVLYKRLETNTQQLKIENSQLRKKVEELERKLTKQAMHPSYKFSLKDSDILEEYKKAKSFYAVGKVLGCNPKTIKNRLIKMGYAFK